MGRAQVADVVGEFGVDAEGQDVIDRVGAWLAAQPADVVSVKHLLA
jgi:hypothetical protein